MAQLLGAVPIFALWMSILALLVGLLARLSLFAIPVLGLFVVYGLAIEFFKLADNHEIRSPPKDVQRPDMDDGFKQWLANARISPPTGPRRGPIRSISWRPRAAACMPPT